MAPEHWDGIADERGDVYSLGCTLAAVLCNKQLPRPAGYSALLREAAAPESLIALIEDSTNPERDLRIGSMPEFIERMDRVIEELSGALEPDSADQGRTPSQKEKAVPGPTLVRPKRRSSRPLAAGLGLILILALAAIGLHLYNQRRLDQLLAAGRAAIHRGEYGMAEAILRDVIDDHPHHGEAAFLLGKTLSMLHREPEAVPYLEAAVRENPSRSERHRALALAYLADGRYSAALAAMKRALELDPENKTIQEHLDFIGALIDRTRTGRENGSTHD